MRRLSIAVSCLLLLPLVAKADTFKFSIAGTGAGFIGSGTLTATSTGNPSGSYLVNGITGTGVTGLIVPNDPAYGYGNDNLFYPSAARLFNVNGIAFYGTFGSVNLFSTVSGYEAQGFDASSNYFDTPVTLAVSTVTPEPSSIALSFTGLLGAAMLLVRKSMLTGDTQAS